MLYGMLFEEDGSISKIYLKNNDIVYEDCLNRNSVEKVSYEEFKEILSNNCYLKYCMCYIKYRKINGKYIAILYKGSKYDYDNGYFLFFGYGKTKVKARKALQNKLKILGFKIK